MKKTLSALLTAAILINGISALSFAESGTDDLVSESYGVIRIEESESNREYTDYEIAVSKMIEMGWEMEDIKDLDEEEILKHRDVISYSSAESYICTYTDESGVEQMVSVPKDVYDHHLNKRKTENSDYSITLTNMSSDGTLSLTPMWSSENYDAYAFSGQLAQKAYLTWMENMTYFTNYRCEWETEPTLRMEDAVYICNSNSVKPISSSKYFIYKYESTELMPGILNETKTVEVKDPDSYKMTNNGIGYVCNLKNDITPPDATGLYTYADNHRIYISHKLEILSSTSTQVVTCAGYYHRKVLGATTSITNITSTGATLYPNNNYTFELGSPTLYLCATK